MPVAVRAWFSGFCSGGRPWKCLNWALSCSKSSGDLSVMIRVSGFCTRVWAAGCVAGWVAGADVGWVVGDADEDEGVEGSVTGGLLEGEVETTG